MNNFIGNKKIFSGIALSLSFLMTGCGGGSEGQSKILGVDNVTVPLPPVVPLPVPVLIPPTVTAVAPVNNATGVPFNNTIITAAFSEPISPITGTASFVVTCAAPCISPTGTVALNSTNQIGTYTLAPETSLTPNTLYTGTITGVQSIATGLTLVSPYVWKFKTGLTPSVTRPAVTITVPATTNPGPTTGVAANTAITAVFTKDMAPATINTSTFTLSCTAPCVAPTGSVSYSVGSKTAVFLPAAALTAGSAYTATITSAATDLAGNALGGNTAPLPAASNYVWKFNTSAAIPVSHVTVLSTKPAANTLNVCPNASINSTFSVPNGLRMDPATINTATFSVMNPALVPVTASSVVLDSGTGRIATFTPLTPLTVGVTYTAKLKSGNSGVKDLAIPADTMLSDYSWNFKVVSCVVPSPISLGSAASYGTFGGSAGMTNQGTLTVINGDIGTTAVSTAVTGFHDLGVGCTYTETPLNQGLVNGSIDTAAPPPTVACPNEGTAVTFAAAQQALLDANAAYLALTLMPPVGANPGANLAGLTITPGVYPSASGSYMIQGGNLTLDAQGDANAVWVFQMATTLTVGGPGAAAPASIVLANGAQAKNVFWQVGSAATINAGGGGTMVGTIISQAGVVISTAGNVAVVTLNGRALSLGASVTMVNTVINVPAP
ncbi:MAG: DUF3494 domain-containing protein [Candidatus Saccharibacteria bacterium]|nr:DUF3494 domain-containing protein [Moraxellaceae bacterium]